MVSRALGIPFFDECACTDPETIAAVCVADLKNGARHRFALGNEQFE